MRRSKPGSPGEGRTIGRILFIDDDKTGREVALFNLRLAGYELTPAADGQGGLSLVDLERKVIEAALRLKKGNMTQAAAYLRIPTMS